MIKRCKEELSNKVDTILEKRISNLETYVNSIFIKSLNSKPETNNQKTEYNELFNCIDEGLKKFQEITDILDWEIGGDMLNKYKTILSKVGKIFLLKKQFSEFYKYLIFVKSVYFIFELSYLELCLTENKDILKEIELLELNIKIEEWIPLSNEIGLKYEKNTNIWIQIAQDYLRERPLFQKKRTFTGQPRFQQHKYTVREQIENKVNSEINNLINLQGYNDHLEELMSSAVLRDLASRIGSIYQNVYENNNIKLQLSESENIFRKQGDIWNVVYKGKSLFIKHFKGMNYINYLLHKPHHPIECIEFIETVKVENPNIHINSNLSINESPKQQIMDKKYLADIKKEFTFLKSKLDEARLNHEYDKIESLTDKIEELDKINIKVKYNQIKNSDFDRIRHSIYKNYITALDKINKSGHTELYKHLHTFINTGLLFNYNPDSEIHWD